MTNESAKPEARETVGGSPLKAVVKCLAPRLEVKKAKHGGWQIYKRIGFLTWRARATGPFGFNNPWMHKIHALDKIKAMQEGKC